MIYLLKSRRKGELAFYKDLNRVRKLMEWLNKRYPNDGFWVVLWDIKVK